MKINKKRIHVSVKGIVQGVGFRFYIYQHAKNRNLNGWVRNRINGNVEVVAEGFETDLEFLKTKLEQGPEMARVSGIEIKWLPYVGDLPNFTVLSTK